MEEMNKTLLKSLRMQQKINRKLTCVIALSALVMYMIFDKSREAKGA